MDQERRPFALSVAVSLDAAAVSFRETADDGQPESEPSMTRAIGDRCLVKAVEYMR